MSIRRVYVCDRCGAEAPALDREITDLNIPTGWSKVSCFPGVRMLGRVNPRSRLYHLCPGCTSQHRGWLTPVADEFGGA